jgi:ATP-binding cassette, subfamily F, member 3
VILVSHDRHLIEACADRLLLVANGNVWPFEGDLDDYQRLVLTQRAPVTPRECVQPAGPNARAQARRAAAEKRTELAPLRRRIADIEARVRYATAEIARVDAALAEGGLFAQDPGRAAELAKARRLCERPRQGRGGVAGGERAP